MGIRPSFITKAGNKIFELHHDKITDSFELNKEFLNKYVTCYSKDIRNKLAGYLVLLKNREGIKITHPKQFRKARNKKERNKFKKQRRNWIE